MAIGQHGSWNRSTLSGYKVVFIPFADGRPAGPARDILLVPRAGRAGLLWPAGRGHTRSRRLLLVADDVGDVIWRVTGAA